MIWSVSCPGILRTADLTGLWAVFELQSWQYQRQAWGSSEQCWAEENSWCLSVNNPCTEVYLGVVSWEPWKGGGGGVYTGVTPSHLSDLHISTEVVAANTLQWRRPTLTDWLPHLGLRDLGTSRDLSGGNLSLVLRSSLESWELVLLRPRSRPSKLLLLEVRLSLVDLVGWLQPRYFILASRSRLWWMLSSSSLWLRFCCCSWATRSSASASFFRNSAGMLGGWAEAGAGEAGSCSPPPVTQFRLARRLKLSNIFRN